MAKLQGMLLLHVKVLTTKIMQDPEREHRWWQLVDRSDVVGCDGYEPYHGYDLEVTNEKESSSAKSTLTI